MRLHHVLFAAAAVLAGCGSDPVQPDATTFDADLTMPDATAREVITETLNLAPGELVEGIMTGGPADHAVIHLVAPIAEMDWNIHGHTDGQTQTVYEELNQTSADYVFTPTAAAAWWLLIRNSGPTNMEIQLQVELHGDLQWEWQ